MATLQITGHHTVYRNPDPSRVSEYVAFPSLVTLPDDTLLCLCRHGSARESIDGGSKIHRSHDGGRTWVLLQSLATPTNERGLLVWPGGLAVTTDGDVLACQRASPEMGDQARTYSYLSQSRDGGESWAAWELLAVERFNGTAIAGSISSLSDGTIILTGETPGDGKHIGKGHWITLLTDSKDGGRTWDELRVVHDSACPHYFDLVITRLADGRWLASYWTHDVKLDQGLNVHMAVSSDNGRHWSKTWDAKFWGQLTPVHTLRSGRVLAVTNHRRPPMGIRALLSEDDCITFDESQHVEIWGINPAQIRSAPSLASKQNVVGNVLDSYHYFTFGTPSIAQLSDDTIVVAYYITEESLTYVRCCRMIERT